MSFVFKNFDSAVNNHLIGVTFVIVTGWGIVYIAGG